MILSAESTYRRPGRNTIVCSHVERKVVIKPGKQAERLDFWMVPLCQVFAVSRLTENFDDAPSSLTIIEGQELRAFGYPHIAEALRGVRGLSLSNDSAYYSYART